MNNNDLILEVIESYIKNAEEHWSQDSTPYNNGYFDGVEALGYAVKELLSA